MISEKKLLKYIKDRINEIKIDRENNICELNRLGWFKGLIKRGLEKEIYSATDQLYLLDELLQVIMGKDYFRLEVNNATDRKED